MSTLVISASKCDAPPSNIPQERNVRYIQYTHALEARYLADMKTLISTGLSEPYTIYVYRYFLCQWSQLCFLAVDDTTEELLGVIICKLERHDSPSGRYPSTERGYIAMLVVSNAHRGKGIATRLVRLAIDAMIEADADEVVLEAEETNLPAMRLYTRLGFIKIKMLHRYYLSGSAAYRLILPLKTRERDTSEPMDDSYL